MPIDPLPCAFKRGRKRIVCGGYPDVLPAVFDGFYACCRTCCKSTGVWPSPEGAKAEWNRWMEMESR